MSTGQAPMLMLDAATSHMRDRLRATRGLARPAALRRSRAARVRSARTR
jgi:hypothetical protein